jgi:hypothetical protein
MTRLAVALLVATTAGACLSVETKLLAPPTPAVCRDGRPIRILQDPECTDGICGYTCAPGRWTAPNGRIDQ